MSGTDEFREDRRPGLPWATLPPVLKPRLSYERKRPTRAELLARLTITTSALDLVQTDQRVALLAAAEDGASLIEISTAMRIPRRTVRWRLWVARRGV